jgi:tetratricopeptide (TPR) repeat protein
MVVARRSALPLLLSVVMLAACQRTDANAKAAAAPASPALRIALAPHAGSGDLDQRIRDTQAKVAEKPDVPRLERLATMFVAKARGSGDPGFYRLAEACADAMPRDGGGVHAAELVRGHVRHSLHDFAAAEVVARRLVRERGLFLDHGLLGDVLLDLGRTTEARDVYQRMLDLKPCLQSYARAAQLRWVQGDLAGCRELLALAASAGSTRDPDSMAWVLARRATLELHANDAATARAFADLALQQLPDHPGALLAHGRAALALGDVAAACASLEQAVAVSPLPEHAWALVDALRASQREADAGRHAADLRRQGEREDPRTFAAWLATTDGDRSLALRLAEAELRTRQDALTHDVAALARWRSGDLAGATAAMREALASGTVDARVHLHGALIADAAGDRDNARSRAQTAAAGLAALLPSERALLASLQARL